MGTCIMFGYGGAPESEKWLRWWVGVRMKSRYSAFELDSQADAVAPAPHTHIGFNDAQLLASYPLHTSTQSNLPEIEIAKQRDRNPPQIKVGQS